LSERRRGLAIVSSLSGFCVALFSLPAVSAPETAFLNGSARADYRHDEDLSVSQVDVWFDTRAYYRNWEASARLRIHQTIGDPDDVSIEDIDRRHVAFVLPELDILAGNYYVTFGNGVILRTLEQRFVTLNRVDRAFNLDRNLDGLRVRTETGPVRLVLVSGKPDVEELAGSFECLRIARDDLLQGGEGTLSVWRHLDVALGYLLYDTPDPGPTDARETEDLISYQVRGEWRSLAGAFEYGEKRHRPVTPRGIARYARVEGGWSSLGVSLEWKSYRNFFFCYNELPTLVRTHESVLLNRATHVLLPDDERGIQAEAVYAPSLFTTLLLNLAGSEGSAIPGREFREVYLEGRSEVEGVGGGRLGLDWARDRTKLVEDQWTAAVELEKFVGSDKSLMLDLELQAVDTGRSEHTNQLLQLAVSRAGLLTVALTGEHSTRRSLEKRDWYSVNLDLRLSQAHDVTLWYGSRPEGIVCSGGFCFFSEAFDGLEARLMSRF
jgi:hypothetical protein